MRLTSTIRLKQARISGIVYKEVIMSIDYGKSRIY